MKLRWLIPLLFSSLAFAAGGTCPSGANYYNSATDTASVTLASMGITSCYYVASNGSDSNDGLSEANGHPWAHAPFMVGCTGNCATVTGQSFATWPGEAVIFRGGDTYTLTGTWNWNTGQFPVGSASHPIYLGVDSSWFSGGSWARPILTFGNPVCGSPPTTNCTSGSLPTGITQYYVASCAHTYSPNNMINLTSGKYFIIDNFEMTGLCQTSTGQPNTDTYIRYGSISGPMYYQNLYIHGWTHLQFAGQNSSGACNTGVCFDIFAFQGSSDPGSGFGDVLRYDAVDGADSDPVGGGTCFKGLYDTAYSIFRYQSTCLPGALHTFHDNTIEYFWENGHSDMLAFSENSTSTDAVYNNVIRHINLTGATGTPLIWANPPTSTTVYIFNNLGYDVGGVEYVNMGSAGQTYGTYVVFNNTFQTNVSQAILNCSSLGGSTSFTLADTNNHFIDDVSQYSSPCSFKTSTTSLLMSNATATSDGYTNAQTFAYSPTSGGSPTVGAGTNKNTAYCGALTTAGLTDAATKCLQGTNYACSYNSTSHTVSCPALAVTARPTSAAWDQGAYEYPVGSTPQVATPNFAPSAGTYTSAQSVTISTSTGGATIGWTNDGSTPTANGAGTITHGTTYSGPVSVPTNQTLKAVASESGFTDSSVASALYNIQAATPTFGIAAGTYYAPFLTSITCSTGSVACYNTTGGPATDGSTGCSTGTLYTAPVVIPQNETFYGICGGTGYVDGNIGSAAYQVRPQGGSAGIMITGFR